jgi:predicted outer membrane repeat protein
MSQSLVQFKRAALAGLCLTLFAFETLYAKDLNVPADYRTITAALAAASDGDTIRVAQGGTFSAATGEHFPLRLNKAVTLQGEPTRKPLLQGDNLHTVVLIESGGVTLRGFRITDGNGSEGINSMDGGGVCIFVGPGETRPVNIDDCTIEDCTCPSDETYDGCGGGIYCGGTYCTCFRINITDCVIRHNSIRGCGGGVFCALLSRVNIDNTQIEENVADDHGGGAFVDVYASLTLTISDLVANDCPGDPLRADWGGKGGGLACESYGLFTIADCNIAQNEARYYGGGIFTRGGLFEDEDACGNRAGSPHIANSRIQKNLAEVSGGGVYVASSGVLGLSDTTLYWNDASEDGGGLFVAGTTTSGGFVDCTEGCLLEGNESARHGGGIYLGPNAAGTFQSTRFLGNSCLLNGGALYLSDIAAATLSDCLITYNNTARGNGGGLYLGPQSTANLAHCSVVGNFSPFNRSGLYLDPNATADIKDSILWRNAGGSIEVNGASFNIATSLNEDATIPVRRDVLSCVPGYVGWGSSETVTVSANSTQLTGSVYPDLQEALNGFDLRLGADSPCLGAASDGGNIGADTGVGDVAGNTITSLLVLVGTYDIRGRNIIFIRDIQGSTGSVIRNAVFGHVESGYMRSLAITGEEIFGGLTVRADIQVQDCTIHENTALTDGGGLYVADGNCVMTDSLVAENKAQTGKGAGVFAAAGTGLSLTDATVQSNWSRTSGGGIFLDATTTCTIIESTLESNTANRGGGVYVLGTLETARSTVKGNHATVSVSDVDCRGGGVYVSGTAKVLLHDSSTFAENSAGWAGGALSCQGGDTQVTDCVLSANTSQAGGAIMHGIGTLKCQNCLFSKNMATGASDKGGAVFVENQRTPSFVECSFEANSAFQGGVGFCDRNSRAVFEQCAFKDNTAVRSAGKGGCFYLTASGTEFLTCTFSNSSATGTGGTIHFCGNDGSTMEDCQIDGSSAGSTGGALHIMDSAHPALTTVTIANARSGRGGGVYASETTKPKFVGLSVTKCQATSFGAGFYACDSSQSTFSLCEFSENCTTGESADGGGAYFIGSATGVMTACRFLRNESRDDGAGIGIVGTAKVDLLNALFVSNIANNTGGGVYATSTKATTLKNCTIVSNVANGKSGGGLYADPGSAVTVDSSILFGNAPDGIQSGANPNVVYSCIQGESVWPGVGNIFSDPQLDSDFGLLDGSPCVDAGNPDPSRNDAHLPPGKGTERNDMGLTGGPQN